MIRKTAVIVGIMLIVMTGFVYADSLAKTHITAKYEVTGGKVESVFTLKPSDGAPMPGGVSEKSITLNESGNIDFGEISFDSHEIYKYYLTKSTKDMEGLTKDETAYTVYIVVSAEGIVSTIYENSETGEKPAEIVWSDVLIVGDEKKVTDDPPVLKKVEGTDKKDKFVFRLTAMGDYPMPEGVDGKSMDMEVTAGNKEEFGIITFTSPGEYYYQITEVDTKLPGYKYDDTVFDIKYIVTDTGDNLAAQRIVTTGGEERPIAEFEFLNVYSETPPGEDPGVTPNTPDPKPSIPEKITHSKIYKDTIGRAAKTGDSFNPIIMIITMLIALGGIGAYLLMRRRENKKSE